MSGKKERKNDASALCPSVENTPPSSLPYRKIESVSEEIVEKTLPYLSPVVAAMVQVQRLSGMRPQDVRNCRACDFDRSGDVWKYTPYTHKTEHLGKNRIIAVGPKAQAILTPYLEAKAETPEAFLFSPKDAVQLQKVEKRKNRKSVGKNGQVLYGIKHPTIPKRLIEEKFNLAERTFSRKSPNEEKSWKDILDEGREAAKSGRLKVPNR